MSAGGREWERFERAAEYMRTNSALKLSNEQKLQLYGYFKQAKEGVCATSKPGIFDFTGRAKWEAWHSLGDMTKSEAVEKYIATVSSIAPAWETVDSTTAPAQGEGGGGEGGGGGGGGGVGPVVSRMANHERELAEEEKTVFDWCKEGRQDKLDSLLTLSPAAINTKDNQGMALIHWACDRGHLPIAELLVGRGADVNLQDADGQTPLHYASSCDQCDVVTFLLSNGADPTIKDCDELTPVQVAGEPSTKQLFQT